MEEQRYTKWSIDYIAKIWDIDVFEDKRADIKITAEQNEKSKLQRTGTYLFKKQ